jgi:hypothetical protein
VPETTKGPASYFPSIEARYGQPIAHWQHLLRAHRTEHAEARHMDLVAWLKSEHGLGHGHANALVAATSSEDERAWPPGLGGGREPERLHGHPASRALSLAVDTSSASRLSPVS